VRVSAKFIDRLKVRRRLRDYPIYTPPFARSEPSLSRKEMDANYNYFLEHKAARLEYLAKYLDTFSVQLRFEPETLLTLERWLYRYGGHLVPARSGQVALSNDPRIASALFNYEPTWVGQYHGLNIINDIAIFAGEYIVSKNDDARWGMWHGWRKAGSSNRRVWSSLHLRFAPLQSRVPLLHADGNVRVLSLCAMLERWMDIGVGAAKTARSRSQTTLFGRPQPGAPSFLSPGQRTEKTRPSGTAQGSQDLRGVQGREILGLVLRARAELPGRRQRQGVRHKVHAKEVSIGPFDRGQGHIRHHIGPIGAAAILRRARCTTAGTCDRDQESDRRRLRLQRGDARKLRSVCASARSSNAEQPRWKSPQGRTKFLGWTGRGLSPRSSPRERFSLLAPGCVCEPA